MVEGFIPDYMHCVLRGVTHQLVCLFIESSGYQYSISGYQYSIRILDARKKDLKLPHESSRRLLLDTNITANDITKADDCLRRFVSNVKNIYGATEQSYNIHLLLHLPDTGLGSSVGQFMFEDSIGKLKDLHHGTKSLPLRITSGYTSKSLLAVLISK
nr:uncharacterized protein LOC122272428 [Parasteatoda tepidariorum]